MSSSSLVASGGGQSSTLMPQNPTPKVIACGHVHIAVKTGNYFPAFLIQFPLLGGEKRCREASEDAEECSSVATDGCRNYFWRTKRDFLVLNRSLHKYHPAISYPKSAFSKLCNHAMDVGAWIRPDEGAKRYSQLVPCSIQKCTRRDGDEHDAFEVNNNFDTKLKKSLYLMDKFLCDVHKIYVLGGNRDLDSASNEALKGVVDAWTAFCRGQDTQGLVVPGTGIGLLCPSSSNGNLDQVIEDKDKPMNAARLGQYFASDENAKDVVNTTLQLIDKLDYINKRILFIEPSCGDGRIILELLNSESDVLNNATIIGCDIDPTAIHRSKQNFEAFNMPPSSNCWPLFRCGDFMTLTKAGVVKDLELSDESSLFTVVFGGPPYTPKDLPEKFIQHSLLGLGADIIVFLLPERCGKDAAGIRESLNCRPDNNASKRQSWQFVNKELANSTFDFEGGKVTQPSVLQFWRKEG